MCFVSTPLCPSPAASRQSSLPIFTARQGPVFRFWGPAVADVFRSHPGPRPPILRDPGRAGCRLVALGASCSWLSFPRGRVVAHTTPRTPETARTLHSRGGWTALRGSARRGICMTHNGRRAWLCGRRVAGLGVGPGARWARAAGRLWAGPGSPSLTRAGAKRNRLKHVSEHCAPY